MLLPLHAFDRGALALPDRRDVEEGIGLPAHLFGLVRLEEIDLRRAGHRAAGGVPPGVRDHPALQRELHGVHVIGLVGVVLRVGEDEIGRDGAHHLHDPLLVGTRHLERVVAEIEAHQLVHPEFAAGALGLVAAGLLDLVQGHAGLLPEPGALAALAEGQAQHRDRALLLGMQRDRAPAAPDEIGGMGADYQGGSDGRHGATPVVRMLARVQCDAGRANSKARLFS